VRAPGIPVIDLMRQHDSLKGSMEAALLRVLRSGRFIGGPETEAFEREYAEYCGTRHCVAVGSGTSALYLALRASGVGAGDEVITSAFTISATMDAIVALAARPVLVDVEKETYTLNPELVRQAIGPRTRAVMPVHIYGHPAAMSEILDITEPLGLPVIADACEAHGALYRGRPVTQYGTANCTSFYPTKNMGALGDAGAVLTNDDELALEARRLRYHGWDQRFHSVVSSMNSRMDELQAAVLRTKLPHLDRWNQRRRSIATRYDEALQAAGMSPAPSAAWATPSYYIYVARVEDRVHVQEALAAAGVATDVHWPSTPHLQPAFSYLGYGPGSFPVTEWLCQRVLTLPMFPELTDAEVERVCVAIAAPRRSKDKHSPLPAGARLAYEAR